MLKCYKWLIIKVIEMFVFVLDVGVFRCSFWVVLWRMMVVDGYLHEIFLLKYIGDIEYLIESWVKGFWSEILYIFYGMQS